MRMDACAVVSYQYVSFPHFTLAARCFFVCVYVRLHLKTQHRACKEDTWKLIRQNTHNLKTKDLCLLEHNFTSLADSSRRCLQGLLLGYCIYPLRKDPSI